MLIMCLIWFPVGNSQLDQSIEERLKTVVDGPDTLGEGFAALIEDVRGWKEDFIPANRAQTRRIMEDPARARGLLFSLQGTAEQGTPLAPPWGGVEEWFVRDANGDLFCIYIVGESQPSQGMQLSIPARFYKTIEMEGRDKRLRMYPTFVTSSIVIPALAVSSEVHLLFPLLAMVLLGGFIVFLLSRSGGKNKYRSRRLSIETEEVLDAANEHVGELPEDSSKALGVMYEQSEAKE